MDPTILGNLVALPTNKMLMILLLSIALSESECSIFTRSNGNLLAITHNFVIK